MSADIKTNTPERVIPKQKPIKMAMFKLYPIEHTDYNPIYGGIDLCFVYEAKGHKDACFHLIKYLQQPEVSNNILSGIRYWQEPLDDLLATADITTAKINAILRNDEWLQNNRQLRMSALLEKKFTEQSPLITQV